MMVLISANAPGAVVTAQMKKNELIYVFIIVKVYTVFKDRVECWSSFSIVVAVKGTQDN